MENPTEASSMSSSIAASREVDLRPTTELLAEECPKFRLLIVGRSNTGKSSLINAIFKVPLADHRANQVRNIDAEITSPHNEQLIIHDAGGYEPGHRREFTTLARFIVERSQKEAIAERVHAIWFCVTAPCAGNQLFEGDEKIFKLNRNKVPMIVVFTKIDLLIACLDTWSARRPRESNSELAERYFKGVYGQIFEKSMKNMGGRVAYALVATSFPETLQRLVDITMKSMCPEIPNPSKGFALVKGPLFSRAVDGNWLGKADEDVSDSEQIALAIAQCVDMQTKVAASVKVGRKKYWRAITSGLGFLDASLEKCLYAIHKDILTIWNIRNLDEFNELQIMRLITNGERPSQLQSPKMEGKTWNLIQSCWESVPSKRPKMKAIVEMLTLPA